MIKSKISIYSLITFFHIALFGYFKNGLYEIFSLGNENINFFIKIILSLLVIIFLLILVKKNSHLLKSYNLDKIDKIFLIFIIPFSLNYFISYYLDYKISNLKNIYFLLIFALIFLILRFVSISIKKPNKNIIFLFSSWFLFLLFFLKIFIKNDIFSTSANPISLVFYIVYVWVLANENKPINKIFNFMIFLCIFYLLDSKFFIIFSIFGLIFSFKKLRYFDVKKLFFLFITLYFLVNLILPSFVLKKFPEMNNTNKDFVHTFYVCKQLIELEYDISHLPQFSDEDVKFCLNINKNNLIMSHLLNYTQYYDNFSFIYSAGYRFMHIFEVYNFAQKNYYLPYFLSYSDLVKLNKADNKIKQSTPHNSFAIILLRLGFPGLILIFYFFYKIISYRGRVYNSYYKYNLLILLGYFSLNDQLFFHNFIASLFFWFFCTQIVYKNN
jgi:hypothetical protein